MSFLEVLELPIEKIIVENRARLELGDLSALAASIQIDGLLHPIILDEQYRLLAGGRRYAAHLELKKPTILCRIIPGLTARDASIIEMVENTTRKDFNWQEELQLMANIHTHFIACPPADLRGEEAALWTIEATAARLGISPSGLGKNLKLYGLMKVYPELATYQTKAQAMDAMKKFLSRARAASAVQNMSDSDKAKLQSMLSVQTASGICTTPNNVLRDTTAEDNHQNDSSITINNLAYFAGTEWRDMIERLPDNSVGVLEADPPYAINFTKNYGRMSGLRETELEDWDSETYMREMSDLLTLMRPKLITGGFILIWTAFEWIDFLNETLASKGYRIQPGGRPGVWVKPGASANQPQMNMITNYEFFLLASLDTGLFNTASMRGALSMNTVAGTQRIHPTEKPRELYDTIFTSIARPGTICFSAFAGSGNALLAAIGQKMIPIGTDKSTAYLNDFLVRLNQEQARRGGV